MLSTPSTSPLALAIRELDETETLRHVLGTRIVGYSYASAVTFLIYDILLTLPDEVRASFHVPSSGICSTPVDVGSVCLAVRRHHVSPNDCDPLIELMVDSMRMSLTKIAFFFIRYFPPLLSLSTQFYGAPRPHTYSPRACYVWNVYQGLGLILTVLAVDYILILRSACFRSLRCH
ncbi:hypothetical protein FA13DRAFT_1287436 [Coprinellus micaceus]|uniref:DUF6533 domain-containing protein n=1 Tax=Coprinellus micaceus TaxID=71717 RepID=A0A4Y7SSW5_COPMI|nr:hypothetical protein FA13DRAFT_1287436 [Coprinellus micaceus]